MTCSMQSTARNVRGQGDMSQSYSFLRIDIVEVVKKLAADTGVDSPTLNYVLRRFATEGVKFLTSTLPKLSKSVLDSLEKGFFCRPTHFEWKGKSLRYFRSFLDKIFNVDGTVMQSPCELAILHLRQFCEYFYKLALTFDEAQLRQAESNYSEIEQEIADSSVDLKFVDSVRKTIETHYELSGKSVCDVFKTSRPRFGPGAFFGSENTPWNFAVYKAMPAYRIGTCRNDQRPFSGYFRPYPSCKEGIKTVCEGKHSKVLFVPKDSRGPRVISKEPLFLVAGQLAFFDWLSSHLENVTHRRINFTDQSINRDLARKGSIDRSECTLDLKEASDRVSLRVARRLFQNVPAIDYFIRRQRSTHAELPSGGLLRLNKLSGMGSGLTFPIMALIIHASAVTMIMRRTGLCYSKVASRVFVYGDDVIVPREWYDFAVSGISGVNLVVNSSKSFHRGFFRESCGGDYYKGVDVSPVRLRLSSAGLGTAGAYRSGVIRFLRKFTHAACVQLSAHCKELRLNGLIDTAEYYYKRLEVVLGELPLVSGDSSVLGRYTSLTSDVPVVETQRAWCSGPRILKNSFVSLDKFLGSFFRRTSVELPHLNVERRIVFGEIAVPRAIKIRKRLVGYLDLRG